MCVYRALRLAGLEYGFFSRHTKSEKLTPFVSHPVDVANSLSPSPIPSHSPLPRGYTGAGLKAIHMIQFKVEKAEKILGIRYRSREEMVRDTLAEFARRGW